MSKSEIPSYASLNTYLDYYADTLPHQEAVVCRSNRLSYRALKRQVDRTALALTHYGIRSGDRIAVLSTPRPEYWVLLLATIKIGAVWVGLNVKSSAAEYLHVIADSEPRLLFSLTSFEERSFFADLEFLCDRCKCLESLVLFGANVGAGDSLNKFIDSQVADAGAPPNEPPQPVSGDDPAIIVYTSGTTGKPKGAVLSHKALAQGAWIQNQHFKVTCPRVLCCFPINHVACVADIRATSLVAGGTLIFQERFDAKASLQLMSTEKVSIWGGVPTMFQLQIDDPLFESCDLASVQLALWGGAALPHEYVEKLYKRGFRLMTAYGMTETAAHTVFTGADADLEVLSNTVGKPDENTLFRIVDSAGVTCGLEQEGELQFKSDRLFSGYYRQPAATSEAFTRDGWFHTGDVGKLRRDGNLVISGRMSEMYKSGGYNIYPREVELALEAVDGVEMAVVFGVPDNKFQEVGAAYLQIRSADVDIIEDIRAACKTRLANYKVPKYFIPVTAFPLLNNGKVDKKALRLDFHSQQRMTE